MSELYKRNASLNCFSFVNPALIPLLYSDKILLPVRLFSRVFSHSILDSSEFACGSATYTIMKSHTSRRFPLTTMPSCFPARCVTLPQWQTSDYFFQILNVLKPVWNLKNVLYSISIGLDAVTNINCSSQSKQRTGKKNMMQFYNTAYKHKDILTVIRQLLDETSYSGTTVFLSTT